MGEERPGGDDGGPRRCGKAVGRYEVCFQQDLEGKGGVPWSPDVLLRPFYVVS
ncbi:MAG: hypothetical protein MUC88_22015 [Planctomycetes bacterium]|nr:hypothetical protein [Planctomycetota bacterium]